MADLTRHGKKRMKQRLGLGKSPKTLLLIADKALSKGITHKQTTGKLRRYLDSMYLSYHTGNNMRIWSNRVFIFRDMTLITVIPLPSKLAQNYKKYVIMKDESQRG